LENRFDKGSRADLAGIEEQSDGWRAGKYERKSNSFHLPSMKGGACRDGAWHRPSRKINASKKYGRRGLNKSPTTSSNRILLDAWKRGCSGGAWEMQRWLARQQDEYHSAAPTKRGSLVRGEQTQGWVTMNQMNPALCSRESKTKRRRTSPRLGKKKMKGRRQNKNTAKTLC